MFEQNLNWWRRFCCMVISFGSLPNHIAIIMDGNRRHARRHGHDRIRGHSAGFKKLKEVIQWCIHLGIKNMSVFAFSLENFKRSETEINELLNLVQSQLENFINNIDLLNAYGIKVKILGDPSCLNDSLKHDCEEIEIATKNNDRITPGDIESDYEHYSTGPVDLLIRTSGETRLSDFMLWQAERKAVNKYYPPDWRPELGSVNFFRKQKAREKRPPVEHDRDPVFTIRFEMPFNIWCNGCNNHIGMGVRYNANKQTIGKYFTTPMYKFRMKCHLCDNHFEIRTDPQNNDYVVMSGARRKEQRWDDSEAGTIRFMEHEDRNKLQSDPMFRLEHTSLDKAKATSIEPTLKKLENLQQVWKDDYHVNSTLRTTFRNEKITLKRKKKEDNDFKAKYNLPKDIKLLPDSEQDQKASSMIKFGKTKSRNSMSKMIKSAKSGNIFSALQKPVSNKLKSKSSVKLLNKVLHKS